MTTLHRHRAAAAAGLLSTLLFCLGVTAPTASAANETVGVVESVVPHTDTFEVSFLLTGLAPGDHAVPGSVEVEVDGQPVAATAKPLVRDGAIASDVRRVSLVVDISGSMAGDGITAARAAVQAYLRTVPTDVEVGLIAFAGAPEVVSAPTTDRARVGSAASGLVPDGGTSLYDAVLRAQEALGPHGERRILLLSDGEDTSSVTELEEVTARVGQEDIVVDAMLLGRGATGATALTRLTDAGGGRVFKADDDVEAVAAFTSAARVFSEGLTVSVTPPPDAAGAAELRVSASTTSGRVLTGTARVLLPDTNAGNASSPFRTRTALIAGLIAVFTGLATALALAVNSGDQQALDRRRTHAILAGYSLTAQPASAAAAAPASRLGGGGAVRAALGLAARVLNSDREAKLGVRLERAAVRFLPKEWVVLQAVVGLLALVLGQFLGGPLLCLLALAIVLIGFHVWLGLKGSRRQAAFVEEMPDAIQLVASGLASGYSFAQAIDSVVREGRPPVAEEFGRALAEARLGIQLEDALENVANRMASQDFHWVVLAVRVQRDVGGNLSEVLQTVCNTMRERAALRRQVRALSAEGRMSAVVLTLLPVMVGGYLAVMDPVFFAPMLETPLGQTLLAFSAVSLTMGGLWMKKLVKVEM